MRMTSTPIIFFGKLKDIFVSPQAPSLGTSPNLPTLSQGRFGPSTLDYTDHNNGSGSEIFRAATGCGDVGWSMMWCWCFTQDCNGSGGNALGPKLNLGKWKLVSAGESKDVLCHPFVTTKSVVVPSISCFITLRLGSILCRSPCLGISACEGIGCHTFGSLWRQSHKWKDTVHFFWIYHRWAAIATTQGYFPTNFQEDIMLHQEAWFGDQQKSSQKVLAKRGLWFCLVEILKSSQRMLSDFIPWNFFFAYFRDTKGWCPDFQHTHTRDRSGVLRSCSLEFSKMISTGPKKWVHFFQADTNNLKSLVTMFICFNQAERISKQSTIKYQP